MPLCCSVPLIYLTTKSQTRGMHTLAISLIFFFPKSSHRLLVMDIRKCFIPYNGNDMQTGK